MAKLKTFNVQARLVICISTSVKAESMADAIEQSASLHECDFVNFPDGYDDGSIKIIGVYEDNAFKTEQ